MAKKRSVELDHSYSQPAAKKTMQEDYLSALPTELLLKIFGYLKKKDDSIKSLTQTCSRFNNILSSQLGVCLDFDRIIREGYPDIQRSYEVVRIVGSEIDIEHESIHKLLESSKCERTKLLIIGEPGKKTKVKLRTLLFLLRKQSFAYLHIQNVHVLVPRLKLEAIKENEYPRMSELITLMMNDNKGPVLSVFKKKTDLKNLFLINQNVTSQMRKFISSQKQLSWLRTDDYVHMKIGAMPLLEKFEFNFLYLDLFGHPNIFAFAPNLKSVTLRGQSGETNVALLINSASSSIESIEFEKSLMPADFPIAQILHSYPSLIDFKSLNYQWSFKKA